MSRRLLVPLAALLLTIGGLLGFAAWNRGETRGRLTLTERELTLPWQWRNPTQDDDAELRLGIDWQRRGSALDERAWLTDDKLREMGFDVHVPAGAPEAERRYRHALPRIGWVVLEYDGPAWREIEQRRRLKEDPALPRPAVEPSRLVPIDAGADREALARRHATAATLIVPAVIRLMWVPAESGGPMMYGYVERLVVQEVTVPKRLRNALAAYRATSTTPRTPASEPPARFEVDLAVGRLGFPWVTDVRTTR
jgi:hypothetical protein